MSDPRDPSEQSEAIEKQSIQPLHPYAPVFTLDSIDLIGPSTVSSVDGKEVRVEAPFQLPAVCIGCGAAIDNEIDGRIYQRSYLPSEQVMLSNLTGYVFSIPLVVYAKFQWKLDFQNAPYLAIILLLGTLVIQLAIRSLFQTQATKLTFAVCVRHQRKFLLLDWIDRVSNIYFMPVTYLFLMGLESYYSIVALVLPLGLLVLLGFLDRETCTYLSLVRRANTSAVFRGFGSGFLAKVSAADSCHDASSSTTDSPTPGF